MKKKIVFITKALWIGGIETALVNLLKYFDYDKYDVTLLVLKAELDMLDQIQPKCRVLIADREETVTFQERYRYGRLFHLTEKSDAPSRLHKMMMWTVPIIRWAENRLYIRYIKKQMKNERFDTAVIYSDVAGETAIRVIKAGKYLMFYHHGAMRHVYHDKIAYKKCEKIIAVSEHQAEALRKFNPRYSGKVITIPNLTDVAGIREKSLALTREQFDTTKFNIVSVGRVSHEKGMDLAVKACAELVKGGNDNIRWWIVGDGPAMQEVKKMIKELHMEEYVITVGMQTNPYPYMRQADLYVQPSRFEAFGLTILEAMILGKAVLATDTMGAQAIIKNGENGLICDASEKKLTEQIKALFLDLNKLKKLERTVQQIDYTEYNKNSLSKIEALL